MDLKVYTIAEISQLLRIHRTYVSRLIKTGQIKAVKIGKNYRVMEQDLLAFLGQPKMMPFHTIEAIALILKIHRVYVARLIAEKKLAATKIGRFYRVSDADFLKFLGIPKMTTLLTIEELAETLKIHRITAAKLIKNKQIAAIKIGRFYRVPMEALEQFLTQAPTTSLRRDVGASGGRETK